MLTYVEFKSTAFPHYDGESEEINPGRFGKRLAEYLSAELGRRGEAVGELFTEDWGWVVPIEGAGFDLWIGVGNYDDYADGFLFVLSSRTQSMSASFFARCRRANASKRCNETSRQRSPRIRAFATRSGQHTRSSTVRAPNPQLQLTVIPHRVRAARAAEPLCAGGAHDTSACRR